MKIFNVLSLGGGVQSTALLLMGLEGKLEKPDYIVFADTGWESRETYANIKYLQNLTKVHIVKKGNLRDDTLESTKWTSDNWREKWLSGRTSFAALPFYVKKGDHRIVLRRQCTAEYKIKPIYHFIRDRVLKTPYRKKMRSDAKVFSWIGISLDEIFRVSKNKTDYIYNHYPLIENRITRKQCEKFLEDRGLSVPKSACIGCPFKDNLWWRHLKENQPDEWQEAVDFDKAIRKTPRFDKECFVHRDCVSLDEADLTKDQGSKNIEWQNECTGFCGD